MTSVQKPEPNSRKPLRLWPGVAAAVLLIVCQLGIPLVAPQAMLFAMVGGLVAGLLILVWWAFFSRVPHLERWIVLPWMAVCLLLVSRFLHPSIATAGQGVLFYILAIPTLCLALVVWAVATRRLSAPWPRRAWLAMAVLLAAGSWTLVRTHGITGDGASELAWRWTPSPEERLLARAAEEPIMTPPASASRSAESATSESTGDSATAPASATPSPSPAAPEATPGLAGEPVVASAVDEPAAAAPATEAITASKEEASGDWPGFRGPARDGVVRGVRIATDWSSSPPVELWRRDVGPGWSSFAVRGDRVYTQEQRGEDEVVTSYDATTGEPVWTHRDATRFWESNAGAGPRGTPTLHEGVVVALGATGILNVLDANDGAVVWSLDVASDTDTEIPMWGFSSSPLVVDDTVFVAAESKLVAYDLATGARRWLGESHGQGYSSPHLLTIDGVEQVLLSSNGTISVSPADGKLLWEYPWPGFSYLQPAMTPEGDVLIGQASMTGGGGIRRVAIARGPDGWTTEERWTSVGLKPNYNDFVVHDGHAYGFDGSILSCIELDKGARKWKGGRYGYGQLVLLPEQDLLLVLSERGELALVAAKPDGFRELARIPAIEGKTWNHPAMAGNALLVRNGREMVAFRLPSPGP